MIFSNVNNLSITLFLLFVGVSFIFTFLLFKRQKSLVVSVCLGLSMIFLSINIFEIKGGPAQNVQELGGSNILFVLDVSKSMDALDFKNDRSVISRLSTAKIFINSYLDYSTNNSYGLFVFAGETLEILPFTRDLGLYKTILQGVDKNNVSKNGSEFIGIFRSLSRFFKESNDNSLVVIFTDGGEESQADLDDYVVKLNEKNILVLVVGIGSLKGNYIPIGRNSFGQIQYKIYNGKKVISALNESFLKRLSSKYDFEYIHLENLKDLEAISNIITSMSGDVVSNQNINSRTDLTYVFAIISFLFFILFLFFEYKLGKK
ncbi:VWA domain-containing protein [Candidatus Gracilibacteria bacterium 28_42_T64]|nr:VWA domain-containing protein [Candidatus Gracilibacteria bacterium 28_42_T64]